MSEASARRVLVFAPNWLGDAVMALPSFDAIRRHFPSAALAVAARSHLAPLFEMVGGVDEVVPLQRTGRLAGLLAARRDARRLGGRFDVAILLPNSFRAAWIAHRARIPERWGYGSDSRGALLTRAVPRTPGGHQVEYYLRLLDGLGIATDEVRSPESGVRRRSFALRIPADGRDWARKTLADRGWKRGDLLVGLAPGAAYGTAKQWPHERFARLAIELGHVGQVGGLGQVGRVGKVGESAIRIALVGSAGDSAACDEVERIATQTPDPGLRTPNFVVNLAGATDLKQLAAVIVECGCFVSNDSGAMHFAAALGVPVVAIFGSTNEDETAPLGAAHAVIKTDVPCRPCMLRECPLEEHVCMTGIDVARVRMEVLRLLGSGPKPPVRHGGVEGNDE